MNNMNKEQYLFEIARIVLKWANVEYTEEELADLVMLELLNVKKGRGQDNPDKLGECL